MFERYIMRKIFLTDFDKNRPLHYTVTVMRRRTSRWNVSTWMSSGVVRRTAFLFGPVRMHPGREEREK